EGAAGEGTCGRRRYVGRLVLARRSEITIAERLARCIEPCEVRLDRHADRIGMVPVFDRHPVRVPAVRRQRLKDVEPRVQGDRYRPMKAAPSVRGRPASERTVLLAGARVDAGDLRRTAATDAVAQHRVLDRLPPAVRAARYRELRRI